MHRYSYVQVANPRLVYVAFEHRGDFDQIEVPEEPEVDTPGGGRVATKAVVEGSVEVFFQYWVIPERSQALASDLPFRGQPS